MRPTILSAKAVDCAAKPDRAKSRPVEADGSGIIGLKDRASRPLSISVASADVSPEPMADFSGIIEQIQRTHDIRVKRWRKNMTGCAWRVYFHDGRTINWIESPVPRTPISLSIFLHEVGHHVIGFNTYRTRCEEEYHAWNWALKTMKDLGVQPDMRVERRVALSMQYAVDKAIRRGIKKLPESLAHFIPRAA